MKANIILVRMAEADGVESGDVISKIFCPGRSGDTELFQKGHIFCVRPDEKGNLWIGTSQGLFCYNRQAKQIKHFTSANSQLPEGNFMKLVLTLPAKMDCHGNRYVYI